MGNLMASQMLMTTMSVMIMMLNEWMVCRPVVMEKVPTGVPVEQVPYLKLFG